MSEEIITELARVELAGPTLVVAHVRADLKITVPRIFEIVQARKDLAHGTPGALYFIAPGELDWEAATLQADYFSAEGPELMAVAVMVNAPILTTVVNLYFGLFPGGRPIKIVATEEDGYAWLARRGFERGPMSRRATG